MSFLKRHKYKRKPFVEPQWYRDLPPHFRPAENKIKALEKLRKRFEIPHEAWAIAIAVSPVITKRLQMKILKQLRQQKSSATEKELWKMLLSSRFSALAMHGYEVPQEEEIDKIMLKINTFDELCDYIISLEKPPIHDLSEITNMIDSILKD